MNHPYLVRCLTRTNDVEMLDVKTGEYKNICHNEKKQSVDGDINVV